MKKGLNRIAIALVVFFAMGCKNQYDPDQYFSSTTEKDSLVDYFLPYILPRPDKLPLGDRFSDSMQTYYRSQIAPNELQLYKYYIDKDSLHYALFVRRDLKGLYRDYRATAATFKRTKDSIGDIELKFVSAMFRKDTILGKADELFDMLIKTGGVKQYEGNRDVLQWPTQEVYYDIKESKWTFKKDPAVEEKTPEMVQDSMPGVK